MAGSFHPASKRFRNLIHAWRVRRAAARTDHAVVLRCLCCLQAPDGLGIEGNKTVGMLLFFSAQIRDHRAKIKTEPLGIGVPNATDFINYGIFRRGYSSMSSSGVQMTGQT